MRTWLPPAVVLSSVLLAYAWLQIPSLATYALQAFAATALIYLVVKRIRRAKFWHLLPEANSFEMALLTFAFLLLIGATGNTQSPVFFLGYVHLFFLTLTASVPTTLLTAAAVLFFHLSLAPKITAPELQALITLPLLLAFFLFAKHQYDEARLERRVIAAEEEELERLSLSETSLKQFLQGFLVPKLTTLEAVATDEQFDKQTVANQLSLLQSEVEKLLKHISAQEKPAEIDGALTQANTEKTSTAERNTLY